MKQIYFLLFLLNMLLFACSDVTVENYEKNDDCHECVNRLSFSTQEELQSVLDLMDSYNSANQLTRALVSNGISNEANNKFVSLYEAKKRAFYSTLTKEEISSIENDEDELEYCLEDSVIADQVFAEVLNEDREIQVNDTIYKFYKNGIAYVPAEKYSDLLDAEEKILLLNSDQPVTLLGSVTFLPSNLQIIRSEENEEDEMKDITRSPLAPLLPITSDKEPVYLKSVDVKIFPEDVKYQKYSEGKGDGSVVQKILRLASGQKFSCDCKWNDHNKVQLDLINQNYLIYSNVGVKVSKKKKRLGIWWNCKADEIVLGWNVLEMRHDLPEPKELQVPPSPNFYPSNVPVPQWPEFLKVFPFDDGNQEFIVLHMPKDDYTLLSSKDINRFFRDGVGSLLGSASKGLKDVINGKTEHVGLYTVEDRSLYYMLSPDETYKKNKKNIEEAFYKKWFGGTYTVGYSYGSHSSVKISNISGDKSTKMNRGVVYGAAKHGGKWKACVIIKD